MSIDELKQAIQGDTPIEYSAHCLKRMLERGITRNDIKHCILNGEIIEVNPLKEPNNSDKSLPSYLVYGLKYNSSSAIHTLIGYNGKRMLVISAYFPDLEHWEEDLKTRRK